MTDDSDVQESSTTSDNLLPEVGVSDIDAADNVEIMHLSENMLLVRTQNTKPLPAYFLNTKSCVSKVETVSHPMADTPKNRMLYDRENYSVGGKSLYTILHSNGGQRVILSDDPYVAVSPTIHESQYRLWMDSDHPVKTPPKLSEDVLRGIIDVTDEGDKSRLERVFFEVLNNRVRRDVVRFPIDMGKLPEDRIEIIADGWLIDGMFLVSWDATIYLYTSDWKTGSYDPRSSRKREEPGEFIGIQPDKEFEAYEMTVGDETFHFGELEQLFLWRVRWMLDWEINIEDEALKTTVRRTFDDWETFA